MNILGFLAPFPGRWPNLDGICPSPIHKVGFRMWIAVGPPNLLFWTVFAITIVSYAAASHKAISHFWPSLKIIDRSLRTGIEIDRIGHKDEKKLL